MKTIFLTSFAPLVSRNILSSDVLRTLCQRSDLRIVIFCPDYKTDFFRKHFSGPNLVIEGCGAETVGRQDKIFGYLARSLMVTRTLDIHRREIFLRNRRLAGFLFSYVLNFLGFLPGVKRITRWLDFLTISKNRFAAYFDRYQPALVFSTDIFHVDDVHMLAEAKHRGLKTVSMVRSWDNVTNKGLFRIRPDKLVAHNSVIADEASRYNGFPKKAVFVSGLPQFDSYVQKPQQSKKEFLRRIGLDSVKPTILVSPLGTRFYKDDWYLVEVLKSLPYQYILRFPPNDTVDLSRFPSLPNFYVERPGVSFRSEVYRDRELTQEDTDSLAADLYHCDLVILYSSTLAIDAAFFDKPVIVVGFDAQTNRPYLQSVRRLLDFNHFAKLLKIGCCRTVYNKEDLAGEIRRYLDEPSLEREERKKLIAAQVGPTDGLAGKRIAEFLLAQLPL